MVKKNTRYCLSCKRVKKAVIRKYNINLCRMCFRENATHFFFKKEK